MMPLKGTQVLFSHQGLIPFSSFLQMESEQYMLIVLAFSTQHYVFEVHLCWRDWSVIIWGMCFSLPWGLISLILRLLVIVTEDGYPNV